jgi:hypothetical protein
MHLSIRRILFSLVFFSFLVRAFLAFWLELGNDEVYYWTYALYPDWSHYDHPPMLGWVIQLFSLNLLFDSEFALRLSSLVFFTLNTGLIFLAGKIIRDETTGLFAALLYNASVYATVITGIFILPDTPQNLFWFIALLIMLKMVSAGVAVTKQNNLMLLFGLVAGLGMISKYTSVFLWVGLLGFIFLYRRAWLKRVSLYAAMLISAVCGLPVIIWNMQHDFASFAYQGSRVNIFESGLRPDLFATELAGQIFYNNPVNWVLILLAVIAVVRQKQYLPACYQRLLLMVGLPSILLFLLFALFRPTLPHWSGPAYNTLILLAAARIRQITRPDSLYTIPPVIISSLAFLVLILVLGSLQIKTGLIPIRENNLYHRLGKDDVTLDMFGWRALGEQFETVRNTHLEAETMQAGDAIVAAKWFPLANLDYYVARPLGMKALGLGRPDKLHKYVWITEARGGLQTGADYWYLTDSRDYAHPGQVYAGAFDSIVAADTITIMRNGQAAKRVFLFLLKDFKGSPELTPDGLK